MVGETETTGAKLAGAMAGVGRTVIVATEVSERAGVGATNMVDDQLVECRRLQKLYTATVQIDRVVGLGREW